MPFLMNQICATKCRLSHHLISTNHKGEEERNSKKNSIFHSLDYWWRLWLFWRKISLCSMWNEKYKVFGIFYILIYFHLLDLWRVPVPTGMGHIRDKWRRLRDPPDRPQWTKQRSWASSGTTPYKNVNIPIEQICAIYKRGNIKMK